jgi:hypothetical protein
MREKWRRWGVVGLLVLGAAGYLAASESIARTERKASVSVYNRRSAGVSIFAELKSQLRRGKAEIRRSPLLYADDLEGTDALAILSPTSPLTSREGEIVDEWVKEGGTLILGFHDRQTHSRAAGLLRALEAPVTVHPDTRFANGQSVLLSPKAPLFGFEPGESYELYSAVFLEHDACRGGSLAAAARSSATCTSSRAARAGWSCWRACLTSETC